MEGENHDQYADESISGVTGPDGKTITPEELGMDSTELPDSSQSSTPGTEEMTEDEMRGIVEDEISTSYLYPFQIREVRDLLNAENPDFSDILSRIRRYDEDNTIAKMGSAFKG